MCLKSIVLYYFSKALYLNNADKIINSTNRKRAGSKATSLYICKRNNRERSYYQSLYIYEAIEVEKAGLKVSLKKTAAFAMPEEFKNKLDKTPALKKAFESLTPGKTERISYCILLRLNNPQHAYQELKKVYRILWLAKD